MKSAELSYHSGFPSTPISWWAGARSDGWVRPRTASGQFKRAARIVHPFLDQRKLWCLLSVHFQGVDLRFAMPEELDQFIAVMSRNPLPSGGSLVPGWPLGRPPQHWLARLPGKAKPWKFRHAVCEYLRQSEVARQFRAFYSSQPPQVRFGGVFNSFHEARLSDMSEGLSPR